MKLKNNKIFAQLPKGECLIVDMKYLENVAYNVNTCWDIEKVLYRMKTLGIMFIK